MSQADYEPPNISLSAGRKKELKLLEQTLGYTFTNSTYLDIAMTHSSYANEVAEDAFPDNERLEFLGDVAISLVVSEALFRLYKTVPEGELTKLRSIIVSESSFARAARILDLGKYIRLGKGEYLSGGSKRDSLLADAFEALWGAVYLDAGFMTMQKLLMHHFQDAVILALQEGRLFRDYKTQLQETCQRKFKSKVEYSMLDERGPGHAKEFTMAAIVQGRILGKGIGKSKKEAEQMAAHNALVEEGLLHE